MKKTAKFSPPAIGGSSLLAIFALLTLCIFTLLSLSTVLAEKRLSQAAADSVLGYYAADLQAEQTLAMLRSGEISSETGNYQASFPISQHQYLFVEFENNGGQWQILRWQTVAEVPDITNDPLPVWDGNLP